MKLVVNNSKMMPTLVMCLKNYKHDLEEIKKHKECDKRVISVLSRIDEEIDLIDEFIKDNNLEIVSYLFNINFSEKR